MGPVQQSHPDLEVPPLASPLAPEQDGWGHRDTCSDSCVPSLDGVWHTDLMESSRPTPASPAAPCSELEAVWVWHIPADFLSPDASPISETEQAAQVSLKRPLGKMQEALLCSHKGIGPAAQDREVSPGRVEQTGELDQREEGETR